MVPNGTENLCIRNKGIDDMKQHEKVLEYLRTHKEGMTSKDAFEYLGIIQMPKRIWILKRLGYKINTKMESGVNRFGERVRYTRYTLEE